MQVSQHLFTRPSPDRLPCHHLYNETSQVIVRKDDYMPAILSPCLSPAHNENKKAYFWSPDVGSFTAKEEWMGDPRKYHDQFDFQLETYHDPSVPMTSVLRPLAPRNPLKSEDALNKCVSLPASAASDEILKDSLCIGDLIGEGTFGCVYQGEYCGKPVAMKKLKLSSNLRPSERVRAVSKFENEFSILKQVRHPNIVSFLGIVSLSPSLSTVSNFESFGIVTELCSQGTLLDFITTHKMTWNMYLKFAEDIVSGLKFLHHRNIIHRDLKPSNLLLTDSSTVKIADFGLAHMKVRKGARPYGVCGTPSYIAPEVLKNEPYGIESDIFSLGIVLCHMMTGEYRFSGSSGDISFQDRIVAGDRPFISDHCLPDLRNLIQRCWSHNPKERPSIDEVMVAIKLSRLHLDVSDC